MKIQYLGAINGVIRWKIHFALCDSSLNKNIKCLIKKDLASSIVKFIFDPKVLWLQLHLVSSNGKHNKYSMAG
jgi:hypothetical protein